MSSKYYVFTEWQEFDKDAKAHIIKASTPFSAAVAYAIREWGLYHAAEGRYEVYDSRGTACGKFTVPDWVDDTFGETMKEAFLIEVVVERNESGSQDHDQDGCVAAHTTGGVFDASPYLAGLTADRLEFAAYGDGKVVLQGVGYFDFYGGLDDEEEPYLDLDFRKRHCLCHHSGNQYSTCYNTACEAIEALKADGAIHNPDLQAFIDA